ncbi:acyl carrier protein [Streptomyces caelestis]|jgi:acyl carrier protein|uniref:Acyl carrier protein n=1 Tax=Streptomyces caelestis TaxID=36816 RepID=A0A7W9LWD5_9ACTN|nr:acyl carrier protein [Streptomyces caelestis]MBB5798524.1 acyl carrier protein [Streptomyces caelestis]GGW50975.1 hypothetical protein GCM10010320_34530 [Streptomyces caelestis]
MSDAPADAVVGVLSEVLGEPPEVFDGPSRLGVHAGWDSMGMLRVVTMLESDLGIRLDLRRVHDARTVHDLVGLVEGSQAPG